MSKRLAERRHLLVARCADERDALASIIDEMRSPHSVHGAGGSTFKRPLIAAAAAVGLAVLRPQRLLPLVGKAYAAFSTVRPLLAMLRRSG